MGMKESPQSQTESTAAAPTRTVEENRVMLDQQLALGVYLNALLKPAKEVQTETRVTEEVQVTVEPVAPTPLPVAEVPPVEVPEQAPETPVTPAEITEETAVQADNKGEAQPATEGRPDWAEGDFQCLLFRVAGLTLAVPLARLNGVVPWDDGNLAEMPNHRAWFLGLSEHHGQRVKLIDTAAVVLPAERYAQLGPADSGRLTKVVMIDDHRWGLACEDVGEVITLTAEAVKWRTEKGRRPWLAGTVIEHMCALLDTEAFAMMLREDGLASN